MTGNITFPVCFHEDDDRVTLITARPDGSTLCTGCGWSHPDPPGTLTAIVAIIGLQAGVIGTVIVRGFRQLEALWKTP